MRLWSLHPKYLDAKGLTALWREALLAQSVLSNKTNGYKNHPQLTRFKNCDDPMGAIGDFLDTVYMESVNRGYNFDITKIATIRPVIKIPVTQGQIEFEYDHLKEKLAKRDLKYFMKAEIIGRPEVNPLFEVVDGEIECWEPAGQIDKFLIAG